MARKIILTVLLLFMIVFMAAAEEIEGTVGNPPWPENVVPGQFIVPVTRTLSLFGRFTAADSFCTAWQCYIVTDEETAKWHEASGLAPYYEPVVLYTLFATTITTISPTDQWALYATGWNNAFAVGSNAMDSVPNAADNDETPVIAIIDTGMRDTHEALQQAHYTTEYDTHGYVYDSNSGNYENTIEIYDNDTHGTHIAGIIGGPADRMADNRLGGSGMGKVRVLPFNASYVPPSDPDNVSIRSDAVLKAISKIYSLKSQGVPIVAVNMSYGQGSYLQTEFTAMQALYEAGIIAVVAAGNESVDLSKVMVYPANYNLDNIITVAAVGNSGTTRNPVTRFASIYSNYGGATGIAAPGTSILSSVNVADNTYAQESGTSMATPFVAGALGAAYALYNDINGEPPTAQQLMNFLYNSAKTNSSLAGKVEENREIDLNELISYVYNCGIGYSCNFVDYPYRRPLNEDTTPNGNGGGGGNAELFGCGCSLTGGKAKFNYFELAFAVMVFGAYKLISRRRMWNR